MRERYPEFNIPKYPKTKHVESLYKLIDIWEKRIQSESNSAKMQINNTKKTNETEGYQKNIKGYLYICILGIQMFFTKFLKFDNLSGFFEDQMFFIDKYESLIAKISKKYSTMENMIRILEPENNTRIEVLDSNPEIKLVFYLIFYSIIIIIIRHFLKPAGLNEELKNRILNAISGKESILNSFILPFGLNSINNSNIGLNNIKADIENKLNETKPEIKEIKNNNEMKNERYERKDIKKPKFEE